MRNRWVLMVTLLVITGIFFAGCYTIMSHPRVEDEEGITYQGRDYRENCTTCHADYHSYPYGYYYGYYPDYYWDYPRWGHYYVYPWWWDWYWSGDEGGVIGIEDQKIEKERRSLEPPYVTGTRGVFPPVLIEPKSSRETTTKGTIEKVDKEKQPEQKKEETKEKEGKIPQKKR
ncbi:MAG: hypothetical protein OEV55_08100 [candidate division Zixibacteria bacterium]|nr:hypothetical protein [candidate division Zixibacteria bacterium]